MHETEIVEYKKLSDGQFAVKVRCCGDEQHDSWHTVDAKVLLDPAAYVASLSAHRARVATDHQASILAENVLKALVGKKESH